MDKISKFLKTLTAEERTYLLTVLLPKIQKGHLKGLDVKPLKGVKGMYRARYRSIRVLFVKTEAGASICSIGRRKDVYKTI